MGEAPDATVLVQAVAEAEALDLPPGAKRAYVTQTTLSVDETAEIIEGLRAALPATSARRARRTSATPPPTASGR